MRKRKMRNRIKKLTAVGMGLMSFVAFMVDAFYKQSALNIVLFFVGLGWVMLYLQANGGRYHD